MDGPLPPSPGQAQGLEVFGVPAFHPAVSSTLPLAGDGCLHMEPQRDTDWDSGEQHPAMWTEVTARTFSRTPRGTFYYLKWPRSSQGCSRGSASRSRVCLRLPCGSSSAQRPGLWASLGDHTQQLTEATLSGWRTRPWPPASRGPQTCPERQGVWVRVGGYVCVPSRVGLR